MNIEDFFNGKYQLFNQTSILKDIIINNINDAILKGKINFSNIINRDNNNLLRMEDNIIYEITSTNNKNKTKNISTVNLGNCENILKNIYNIDESLPLVIFKVEYFIEGLLIPVIGYEVYHPINNLQLNLSYCKNEKANLNIPVSINEDKLFKHNPTSDYYTDKCKSYTTDNGTDILIIDRKNEFINNNMSLCENNCSFDGYNSETKQVICKCEIKNKQIVISEVDNERNILSNDFKNDNNSSNMFTIKCYYALFTIDGISQNYESYILIFIIITFIILSILFYKCWYPSLNDDIREIIEIKEEEEKIKNINIKQIIDNNNNKNNKKKKIKMNIINNNSKSFTKLELKTNKIMHYNNLETNTIYKYNESSIKFNDYELNSFSYDKSLKYDKRSYFQYYISLLRTKHPLLFSFFPINDYNSRIIKISIFLLFFSINYAINGLFFLDESIIHLIYQGKGKYNIIYLAPQILFSFIIIHIFYILIKYIFLSERNLVEIKKEENADKANNKADKIKRILIIKYICFYISGVLFLLFDWYYLSSFGAVFQNTQIYLIRNTFISLCLSFIYPFFINLFPGIFRIISLNDLNKNKSCMFKISKIIQSI